MPPLNIVPGNPDTEPRRIGRGRVFYASVWDRAANLVLAHLADTEGDLALNANDELTYLTLPEVSGPAKWEAFVQGSDPVLSLPLFLANPALRPVVTPTGATGGAGYSGRRPVKEYTLVVIPEEVFRKADGTCGTLVYTKGAASPWTVGGVAITAEQERLLDLSVWIWRGHFTRPPVEFKHGDTGKTVSVVSFQAMHARGFPEGEKLYTRGDPADVAIDIQPVA